MLNIEQTKQKILDFIKQKGPSLPVPISRHIELSPTFTSAILSELTNAKKIKISNMKVGSSPLYLLPGQEPQLENFLDNIEGVKKTALLKLKQNKILKDEKQEPAIRVALRSIKDFAIPLKFQDQIIWKYFTISDNETESLINQLKKGRQLPAIKHAKGGSSEQSERDLGGHLKQKPLLQIKKPIEKPKKQPKPNQFLEQLKNFLLKKDIELIKEISTDKKEIICITRINSDLGKISFLTVAKDKKRISEADLTVAYQKAQHEKMPCLFIAKGEPSKKIQSWIEDYKNIIKVLSIE